MDGAKMIGLPDGNSALAYKKLSGKYSSQSAQSYVRLNKIFINSELPSINNDPEIFSRELDTIVVCVNKCTITGKSNKSDTDIILQVIAKLHTSEPLQMVMRDIPSHYHPFLDNQIGHFSCYIGHFSCYGT